MDDRLSACFAALHPGREPFRWQRRLYERFLANDIPAVCTLPTGLGKTAVITLWLLALAAQAKQQPRGPLLPRRLVYIVNRRTVVDQATADAERLLWRLRQSGARDGHAWAATQAFPADLPPLTESEAPVLAAVRNALADVCSFKEQPPLAISTLRGEFADNGEWKQDPARPAIVVGTIDMIGSKLLFSGYGDGRYGRAHHAGLIGQDSLIVHDEAHLSPAFSRLLWTVEHEQRIGEKRDGNRARCIRVMELSATTRDDAETRRFRAAAFASRCVGKSDGEVFPTLEEETNLFGEERIRERREAKKRLDVVREDAAKKEAAFAKKIASEALALGEKPCRVLVYVQTPELARDVCDAIAGELGLHPKKPKKGDDHPERVRQLEEENRLREAERRSRVRVLTGTIRGHERDCLADSELLKAFQSGSDRSAPLSHAKYLVSTSAGEVGADWDADHLVCDLTTLDSMAQRFGRVNRLGGKDRAAKITVVCERPKPDTDPGSLEDRHAKTRALLDSLRGDASPASLRTILTPENVESAFSPAPLILPATDILFDFWSLTSIKNPMPGRPPVEPYLHGVTDDDPETHVAWRADVDDLWYAGADAETLAAVFEAFPLRAAETLRDATHRVRDKLSALARKLLTSQPDAHAILIRRGEPEWLPLADLVTEEKAAKDRMFGRLIGATVVLPTNAGGLSAAGMLDDKCDPPEIPDTLDVAEATGTGQGDRQRVWVWDDEDVAEQPLLGEEVRDDLVTRRRITLPVSEADEDAPPKALEYRVAPWDADGATGESGASGRVPLVEHLIAVEAAANETACRLGLNANQADALRLAARWHDRGKDRDIWQRYARNGDLSNPIAKNKRYGDPRKELRGYRHELGSLLEAACGPVGGQPPAQIAAPHPERDLLLHLIAAHHGWARPHFEPKHFDYGERTCPRLTADNEREAAEAMQRFARLQQRFGRWGVAWLESLLRCADAKGSALPASPEGRA